jgi:hypothetical protein
MISNLLPGYDWLSELSHYGLESLNRIHIILCFNRYWERVREEKA